jgi:hypothetical protein
VNKHKKNNLLKSENKIDSIVRKEKGMDLKSFVIEKYGK